jgi:cbb3-type cytochrome oxidase subunit 3
MAGSGRAEIYFVAGMMVLIIIFSLGAVFFFFRTYKREMREKQERIERQKQQARVSRKA